jgi:uncharacterized protein YjbJ (UPF0337 family)
LGAGRRRARKERPPTTDARRGEGRGVTAQAFSCVQRYEKQPAKEEEVAVEKAEGKMKEAYGALTGDEAKKEEGRALQRKAEAEAEAEQKERTRQAEAQAKEAERVRDRQKGKGGLLGDVSDTLPKL